MVGAGRPRRQNHEVRQQPVSLPKQIALKWQSVSDQRHRPSINPAQFTPMEHDNSYKRLFSNPEMVRDLFIGFVVEPWVADIDFDTLEHMQGHYVTDDLRDRENDIIWRVNIKGQRVYVYILPEFQSGVDKFMSALVDWLKAPQQTRLQRDFTVWIRRVLLPGR